MPRKPTIADAQLPDAELQDTKNMLPPQTDSQNDEISEHMPGIQPEGGDNSLIPQTESELAEFTADELSLQEESTNNTPDSQTGTETDQNLAEFTIEITPESQTGTEADLESEIPDPPEYTPDLDATPDGVVLQTEAELLEISPGSAAQQDLSPDSQTGLDLDTPVKTRRRSTKSQSGDEAVDNSAQTEPKPARRRRTRAEPILAIDEQRIVQTDADKMRSDLLDLVESQKGRKILAGTIQGIERSADNPNISFAVIYHGAFKVIIPADETVRAPDDFRDRSPADVMHYLVTKRLGAEIDYIVKGVDIKTGIAAASRLEAMAMKRRQYYYGSDRDGNNLIYEGLSAEARVVSVIRAGIFVDLFGLEVYISLRELSYQRWIDAAAHFQAGQRVLVKILKLDRSDRDSIRVSASVKQAGENPYEQALKRYTPGSRYVGTVSLVDTNGVFVSLDGGIDCLCTYPKRGRPPRGARVTVRVIGINHETNRIWGAITHMTTAR